MNKYILNEENKQNLLNNLLKRSTSNYPEYEKKVALICEDVKERKDEALFEYTLKYDKYALNKDNIKVTEAEIDEAVKNLDPDLFEIMNNRRRNIPWPENSSYRNCRRICSRRKGSLSFIHINEHRSRACCRM